MAEQTKTIEPIRTKWKSAMTDRERFVNQMHHKPADRCFNMEFGWWQECFDQWPMFRENGIRDEGQGNRFFSFDRMAGIGGNVWLNPYFKYEVIEETATTRIFRNGDGLLAEVPKDGHSTIPHFTKSSVTTPEDWKRVKQERLRRDDPARKVDIEAMKQRHPSERDYPLGVNCGSMIGKIRDLLTFEGLAYACYDHPEMVEDMVETACVLVEDFLDQVLPHFQFELATGWEDICFKNGPIVSMDFFWNVITPRYKRIGKKLRAAGVDIWWTDCDGDVRQVIPCFLAAGLNTMFPFEVNCSGHPGAILDQYGPELRVVGGMDKRVMAGSRDGIRKYMESLLPYVEKGGFIPHCDHRCPPDVSQENYLYYLGLKEKMFGMGE